MLPDMYAANQSINARQVKVRLEADFRDSDGRLPKDFPTDKQVGDRVRNMKFLYKQSNKLPEKRKM
jgi:hypothetical protein